MFTGIIQSVGRIAALQQRGNDMRVTLDTGKLPVADLSLGDSVAVNGICLTAVEKLQQGFVADVSGETLSRTTAGRWQPGEQVNLELALTPTTRLGGHLVSGHVDGVGEVVKRWSDGRSERFVVQAPDNLARYIAEKGSICVDGISLTVNAVAGSEFELNIVPHTLQETTMAGYEPGHKVNLEVDVIARYLERLLLGDKAADKAPSAIDETFLAQHGFLK
ncbi:MAG: riboflavin synthase [Gammaproteobacteria bacterium]|jgi:riboflavin synthase